MIETELHPFYLTLAHRHDDERVCLYAAVSGVWYVESGPGSMHFRPVCDREHPDPSGFCVP